MSRKIFYLLFGILPLMLFAQHRIEGTVFDANTGEVLVFANITANNNPHWQTTSDINGNFSIECEQKITQLQCSYIGYFKNEISMSDENPVKIAMLPAINSLHEVVIRPGDNPANRIISLASANRKKNNPESIRSFRYQCYNKIWANMKLKSMKPADTMAWNKFIRGKHLFSWKMSQNAVFWHRIIRSKKLLHRGFQDSKTQQ